MILTCSKDMESNAKMDAIRKHKYCVIEFMDLIQNRKVVVPSSWIELDFDGTSLVVNYPVEGSERIKNRVRRNEERGKAGVWIYFFADVVYQSDTYDEAEMWIAKSVDDCPDETKLHSKYTTALPYIYLDARIEAIERHKYYVVEFEEKPYENIDKYVVIPNSWLRLERRRVHRGGNFVYIQRAQYPTQHDPVKTNKLVLDNKKIKPYWLYFDVTVEFACNTLTEAESWIEQDRVNIRNATEETNTLNEDESWIEQARDNVQNITEETNLSNGAESNDMNTIRVVETNVISTQNKNPSKKAKADKPTQNNRKSSNQYQKALKSLEQVANNLKKLSHGRITRLENIVESCKKRAEIVNTVENPCDKINYPNVASENTIDESFLCAIQLQRIPNAQNTSKDRAHTSYENSIIIGSDTETDSTVPSSSPQDEIPNSETASIQLHPNEQGSVRSNKPETNKSKTALKRKSLQDDNNTTALNVNNDFPKNVKRVRFVDAENIKTLAAPDKTKTKKATSTSKRKVTKPSTSPNVSTLRTTVSQKERGDNLCVALKRTDYQELTELQATAVKCFLESEILANLKSGLKATVVRFKGNPVTEDGVLKLWCEDETTLTWLKSTVAGIPVEKCPRLVVRQQREVSRKVRGVLILQNCVNFLENSMKLLEYQNEWALVCEWSVYEHDVSAEGSLRLVLGIPESVVPLLLSKGCTLAYSLGTVNVCFVGPDGSLQDQLQGPTNDETI